MGVLLKSKPPKKTRMTVREYMAIPPNKHADTLLIYGEMIVIPRPKPKHTVRHCF